ncbi:hypothetical protein [Pseudomonas sp. MWU16-30317]|uniref:hypothetical protein n=1 Tax=Pseudomonas sp. MWU16-30317 TaxID=2878095 RepID=UPI001CF9B746|nr:hypothetical protein [Pseudomonas sp. MWU16-30317]
MKLALSALPLFVAAGLAASPVFAEDAPLPDATQQAVTARKEIEAKHAALEHQSAVVAPKTTGEAAVSDTPVETIDSPDQDNDK